MCIIWDSCVIIQQMLNMSLTPHVLKACIHTEPICVTYVAFYVCYTCYKCIIYVFFIRRVTYALNICVKKSHVIVHVCWLKLNRSNEYMYESNWLINRRHVYSLNCFNNKSGFNMKSTLVLWLRNIRVSQDFHLNSPVEARTISCDQCFT